MAEDFTRRRFLFTTACVGAVLTRSESHCWPVAADSSQNADPLADLDDYLGQALTDWRVPGLAVAVVKDGRRVLVRGYGVRRIGD